MALCVRACPAPAHLLQPGGELVREGLADHGRALLVRGLRAQDGEELALHVLAGLRAVVASAPLVTTDPKW